MKYLRAFLLVTAFFVYGLAVAAPVNDDFIDALPITGSSVSSSITGATLEPYNMLWEETYISYWGGINSIWYKWTAPIDGSVTFRISSQFTPILDIYDGTGVTTISDLPTKPLAYNTVSYVFDTAGVATFSANAGTVYYIRIASFAGESNGGVGSFILTLQETPVTLSDSFSTSTLIVGDSIVIGADNSAATMEVGEPNHGGRPASKSVWLKWTASAHGSVVLSTTSSSFDTLLSVYTGTALSNLKLVADNDNDNFLTKTSAVSFVANADVTYYIAVDGAYGSSGNIQLALNLTPMAPAFTTRPAAQTVFRGNTATFTVVVAGTGAITYQWQRKAAGTTVWANLSDGISTSGSDIGVTYSGSTTTTLSVDTTSDAAVPTNNDQFLCVASDTIGTTNSQPATLTVTVLDTVAVTVQGNLSGGSIDLTNGAGVPASTTYYAKGLPTGLVLDPATGLVTNSTLVTAKPGTYRVSYGTITDVGGKKTTSPALTVVIVVDPLQAGLSGGFETLLEVPPVPGLPNGKVELLVSASTGAFTGKLTFDADSKVYSFKGSLALNATYDVGTASVTISRGKSLNPYRLDLTVDATQSANLVFAAVLEQLDGSNAVVSTLGQSSTGVQLATYTKTTPTPWQGNYTLVMDDPSNPPFDMGVVTPPEGTGFGLITIQAIKGSMSVKGKLGDGTALTASLAPSADGSYRWYGKPYKTGGYFGGWVTFESIPGGGVAPFRMVGTSDSELYWAKSASSSKDASYRAGFGPILLTATAQRWTAPAKNVTLATALNLTTSSGGFTPAFTSTTLALLPADSAALPSSLTLNSRNQVVVTAPAANAEKFLATFNQANGSFTGSFTLQDKRRISVSGVLLQQPSVASGTVVGEGLFVIPSLVKGSESVSGKILFTAP